MTASRVLHGATGVKPASRDAVMRAVETLGYRRDELARNLRLGRTSGLIGLVVTNLTNPFYAELALGVEAVAEQAGYRLVLANTGEDAEREARLVEELVAGGSTASSSSRLVRTTPTWRRRAWATSPWCCAPDRRPASPRTACLSTTSAARARRPSP